MEYQAISKFMGVVYASGATRAECISECKAQGIPRSAYRVVKLASIPRFIG